MKWSTRFIALLSAVLVTLPAPGMAQPRIRDIVDVEGVRENDLVVHRGLTILYARATWRECAG